MTNQNIPLDIETNIEVEESAGFFGGLLQELISHAAPFTECAACNVDPDQQVQQSGSGQQDQPTPQGRARKPGFHGYGLPPAQEMVGSD